MDWNKVKTILEKYEKEILLLPGVVGISTGIKKNDSKEICIKVYLNKTIPRGDLKNKQLPIKLDGIPVEVIISGNIVSFDK